MAVPQIPMRWMCFESGMTRYSDGALQRMEQRLIAFEAELGVDAEGEGDIAAGDVSGAEAHGDGDLEGLEETEDDLLEELGVGAAGAALEHFAEDESAGAFELAGEDHLAQHAIDLVGLGADVFEEQELVLGLWARIGCRERR